MSRIYDNKPLHNLPVISVSFPNKWDPKTYSRYAATAQYCFEKKKSDLR
jgi:hypothetical protein